MTVRQVLQEALQVITREHTHVQLSADERGRKVRNPLNVRAAAWSSVGALIRVAPADAKVTAEHLAPGHLGSAWQAFLLLEEAAGLQGYANTVEVDRAGRDAALRMFWKALQLAPEDERGRVSWGRRSGTGSAPRGATG